MYTRQNCTLHTARDAKFGSTCKITLSALVLLPVQVFQIAVTSTYGVTEFKENLLALYNKAGVKGVQVTFLITDNQIINERFLVYINDFLSTGFITDLCTPVCLPSSVARLVLWRSPTLAVPDLACFTR